jgi:serine protease Do
MRTCAFLMLACAACACAAENTADLRRTPIVSAIAKVRDAVVNISTEQVVAVRRGFGPSFGPGNDPFDRMFDDFFRGPAVGRKRVQQPIGSGCIITPDGLVITNEHVIRRATNIKLSLNSGKTFDAVPLAADAANDLALLRAQSDAPLAALPLGESADLMLGESVIALGNPFGFENSVTSGIVSAVNREIEINAGGETIHFTGLIQTSALINPGNSGGPLVNVLGELIAINTAVVDQAQGIGFAIPIDRARESLGPLLANVFVAEATAGVQAETAPGRKGARVKSVDPKGPAEGLLRPDDVIVRVDGFPVRDLFDLLIRTVQAKPEQKVALRLLRGGKEVETALKLARVVHPSAKELIRDRLGLAGQDHNALLARQMGIAVQSGLLISDVTKDGPVAKAELRPGDVIIQIGPHPVRNVKDAANALRMLSPGDRAALVVFRHNYGATVRVTLGK